MSCHLQKCCFCFVLKAGAMFTGVADILQGTVYVILGTEIMMGHMFVFRHYSSTLGWMLCVVGGSSPVFGILLILAAVFGRRQLLVIVMIHSVLCFTVTTVVFLWLGIDQLILAKYVLGVLIILFAITLDCLELYAFAVVYSYYQSDEFEPTTARDALADGGA